MSKTAQSNTSAAPVTPVTPERLPVAFPPGDLAVAPENLRFGEAPDDGIAQLAETILAA